MTAHKLLAVLINKEDFFGKELLNASRKQLDPTLVMLPDTLCLCERCFSYSDSNRALWRALNTGRDIVLVFDNSTEHRPSRCNLCGRFLVYSKLHEVVT
jgi:hypothetical protein